MAKRNVKKVELEEEGDEAPTDPKSALMAKVDALRDARVEARGLARDLDARLNALADEEPKGRFGRQRRKMLNGTWLLQHRPNVRKLWAEAYAARVDEGEAAGLDYTGDQIRAFGDGEIIAFIKKLLEEHADEFLKLFFDLLMQII